MFSKSVSAPRLLVTVPSGRFAYCSGAPSSNFTYVSESVCVLAMHRIRDDGMSVVHRFAPTLVFMGSRSAIATASGCVTCRALRKRSMCVLQRAAKWGVLRTLPDGSGFVTYFAMYERNAPEVQCCTFMPAPHAKSHSGTYGEIRLSTSS